MEKHAHLINSIMQSPPNVLGNRLEGKVPVDQFKKVTPNQLFILHGKLQRVEDVLSQGSKEQSKNMSAKTELLIANRLLTQMGIPDPYLSHEISSAPDIAPEWIPNDPASQDQRHQLLNQILHKTQWTISHEPRNLRSLCHFIPLGPHTSRELAWEIFSIPITDDPEGRLWCYHIDDLVPYIQHYEGKKIPFPGREYIHNILLVNKYVPDYLDPAFTTMIYEWRTQVETLRRLIQTELGPKALHTIQRIGDSLRLDKHLLKLHSKPIPPSVGSWGAYITDIQRQATWDSIFSILDYIQSIAWLVTILRYASCAIAMLIFVAFSLSTVEDAIDLIKFAAMNIIGNWLLNIVNSIFSFFNGGFDTAFQILFQLKDQPTINALVRMFPFFSIITAFTKSNALEYFNESFVATIINSDSNTATMFHMTEHFLKMGWKIATTPENWTFGFHTIFATCTSVMWDIISHRHIPLLGKYSDVFSDWVFNTICSFIQKFIAFFSHHKLPCHNIRKLLSKFFGAIGIGRMAMDIYANIMFNIRYFSERKDIGNAIRLRKFIQDDSRFQGRDCVSQFYRQTGASLFKTNHDPTLEPFNQALSKVALRNPPPHGITNDWIRKTLEQTYNVLAQKKQLDGLQKSSLGRSLVELMTSKMTFTDTIERKILYERILFSSDKLQYNMIDHMAKEPKLPNESSQNWIERIKMKTMRDILFQQDKPVYIGIEPPKVATPPEKPIPEKGWYQYIFGSSEEEKPETKFIPSTGPEFGPHFDPGVTSPPKSQPSPKPQPTPQPTPEPTPEKPEAPKPTPEPPKPQPTPQPTPEAPKPQSPPKQPQSKPRPSLRFTSSIEDQPKPKIKFPLLPVSRNYQNPFINIQSRPPPIALITDKNGNQIYDDTLYEALDVEGNTYVSVKRNPRKKVTTDKVEDPKPRPEKSNNQKPSKKSTAASSTSLVGNHINKNEEEDHIDANVDENEEDIIDAEDMNDDLIDENGNRVDPFTPQKADKIISPTDPDRAKADTYVDSKCQFNPYCNRLELYQQYVDHRTRTNTIHVRTDNTPPEEDPQNAIQTWIDTIGVTGTLPMTSNIATQEQIADAVFAVGILDGAIHNDPKLSIIENLVEHTDKLVATQINQPTPLYTTGTDVSHVEKPLIDHNQDPRMLVFRNGNLCNLYNHCVPSDEMDYQKYVNINHARQDIVEKLVAIGAIDSPNPSVEKIKELAYHIHQGSNITNIQLLPLLMSQESTQGQEQEFVPLNPNNNNNSTIIDNQLAPFRDTPNFELIANYIKQDDHFIEQIHNFPKFADQIVENEVDGVFPVFDFLRHFGKESPDKMKFANDRMKDKRFISRMFHADHNYIRSEIQRLYNERPTEPVQETKKNKADESFNNLRLESLLKHTRYPEQYRKAFEDGIRNGKTPDQMINILSDPKVKLGMGIMNAANRIYDAASTVMNGVTYVLNMKQEIAKQLQNNPDNNNQIINQP